MSYGILSKEQIGERFKYRIACNGIVLVIWFKSEPSVEEIEKSVNRMMSI